MKYKVQRQCLLEFEVEAGSEAEAEDKGLMMAYDECMYETDGIDFTVSSYPIEQEAQENG